MQQNCQTRRRLSRSLRLKDFGSDPTQFNQAFYQSEIGELASDVFGKNETLTCLCSGQRKSLYGPKRVQIASRYPVDLKCEALSSLRGDIEKRRSLSFY